jgi:hypothetical protein
MNLIEAMQREFSASKQLYSRFVFPLGGALYLVALLSSLDLSDGLFVALAIATFGIQIAVFVLRILADQHYGNGEQIRRLVMMEDGLGVAPTSLDIASIQERISGRLNKEAPHTTPYYASQREKGDARLLETIEESGFFTSGLARRSWKFFAGIAALGVLISLLIIALFFLAPYPTTFARVGATFILASMTFWAAGDFALIAYRFFNLHREVSEIIGHCDRALSANNQTQMHSEAICEFSRYNVALAQAAAPIPNWLYRRYRDMLNGAWASRKES